MKYNAILFDLDGTLWDATHITAQIWPGVLAKHPEIHRTIDLSTVQSYMGKSNDELATLLFPDLPFAKGYALMMEACVMENTLLAEHGGRLYPELAQTLKIIAKSYPLGIVSNCQSGYIEVFLTRHNMAHLFADHICSGDTHLSKADNIRLLLERNSYKNALFVGDTMGDAVAARDAGCDFVWASYGFGTVPPALTLYKIDTPKDLLSIIL